MRKVGSSAKHYVNAVPDTATFEQCQIVWRLMKCCNLEPVWVENLPYAKAIQLINTLEQLRHKLLP